MGDNLSIREYMRKIIPASVRRSMKDAMGMPRWMSDDYYPLRKVGTVPEKQLCLI